MVDTPLAEETNSAERDVPPTGSMTDRPPVWQRWSPWAAVLASALLVYLAFPPNDIGWLAWLAYAPFFWALRTAQRPGAAAWRGYVFGVLHFAALTPWIGVTVNAWSGTSAGWAVWLALALIQGLWLALFGWIAWLVFQRTAGDARLVLVAAAWTGVEHLRTLGGLAMPWGLSAYTQYRAPANIQISDITGFLGVSFLVGIVNTALASLVNPDQPSGQPAVRPSGHLRIGTLTADIGVLVLPCLFYAGVLTYGMLTVPLQWTGRPVMVSLIQPSIPSNAPQPPRHERLGRFAVAVDTVARAAPALTIWPESTVEEDVVHDPDLTEVFKSFAGRTTGYHLVGSAYRDENGQERNSAVLFAPEQGVVGRYDKQRLVPFGEWFPARGLWKPLAGYFKVPPQDLAAGGPQPPLQARDMRLGVLICYESIFPALARDRVRRGANLLVSITNDSWAGPSASPRQHFAMSVFRAVESRRTLCAVGLTGVTGVVSPAGIIGTSEENHPAVASELVHLREGLTPYMRFGDWFPWLCCAVVLYGLAITRPRS